MTAAGRRERLLGLAASVWALLVASLVLAPDPGEAKRTPRVQARPNIVQVMTDDQTVESMKVMPEVDTLLARHGVTFKNSFVSYSLCCPSRATWLTGQYAHNHGVKGNQPPGGGYAKIASGLDNSLPVWLQQAGYYTGHIGKFLNGYGTTNPDTDVPPGWNEWYASIDDPDGYTGGTYTMYGYTLNENGHIVHYGSTPDVVDPATYQTDVYSAKAEDFVRRRAPKRKPFYLSVATLAPHGETAGVCNCAGDNPRAAPRDEGTLSTEPLPRPPNFNEQDVSDKPAEIRNLPVLTPSDVSAIRSRYRARLESLLAVDDLVHNLVDALKDTGELRNTVIIFTSDNGFFHGEHRVKQGKVRVYEESIRVPLVIRGPGFPEGVSRRQLTSNVDLAETTLDVAGAGAGRKEDGLSLVPLAVDKLYNPGRGLLEETFFNQPEPGDPSEVVNRYRAVRTDRYLYAEYGSTGERELYDLQTDPYELQSLHADPAYARVRSRLAALLHRLQTCAGEVCRSRPAVRLDLSFRVGTGPAGRCVDSAVRVLVAGKQRKQALLARFFVGSRKAGVDSARPLRRKIGRAKLSRKRKNLIRAIVTMLDGRETTISRAIPRRC
jgi:N-acetylglucosamine-6-sulfatase